MVKSVYEQLQSEPGTLHATLNQANCLRQLNSELLGQLESTLATHCILANIRRDTAIIQADSPVWAAKLRYQIPLILELLNSSKITADLTRNELVQVQIRVKPNYQPYVGPLLASPQISQSASRFLRRVAHTTSDPRLKRAFSKLARRAQVTE